VGNHEITDGSGASYLRYFGPVEGTQTDTGQPQLYGSFRWGNTRFFLLNAMDAWDSGAERAWLEAELARADEEKGLVWRIAVLHHGPWSAGPHGGNPRVTHAQIPSLFTKHKIDLILAGHDHIYERGFAEGLRYVISGGGGAPLYRVDAPLASTRKYEAAHHFIAASVSATGIDLTTTRDDGSVIERCGFTKASAAWDCDPAKPAAAAVEPAPAAKLTPDAAKSNASRCACRAAGVDAGGAGETARGGALSLLLAAIAIVARRRPR
jgi:hypothetical protein